MSHAKSCPCKTCKSAKPPLWWIDFTAEKQVIVKDGISETQFGDHWFQVHGHLASFMPGVHRYFQNHIRERLFEVQPFPDHEVGGISQQWFDDVAAMERCERSPEYAAVKRDIPNFQGAITILVLAVLRLLHGHRQRHAISVIPFRPYLPAIRARVGSAAPPLAAWAHGIGLLGSAHLQVCKCC